jgi:hypothetical protein
MEDHDATKPRLTKVPDYDDLVEKHSIELLKQRGDWNIVDGDLEMTRRGDIMFNSPDYSALYRVVMWWRFNYQALEAMFDAAFPPKGETEQLERELEAVFARAAQTTPHPMMSLDYDEYHRINDAMDAEFVAKEAYAGFVVVALSRILQSFKADIGCDLGDWNAAQPQFAGHSFGQVIVASANNARHADEWQTSRPPVPQQLKSMKVLSAVLKEPLDPSDGSRHGFGREVSRDILEAICDGTMFALERDFFQFVNSLVRRKNGA